MYACAETKLQSIIDWPAFPAYMVKIGENDHAKVLFDFQCKEAVSLFRSQILTISLLLQN